MIPAWARWLFALACAALVLAGVLGGITPGRASAAVAVVVVVLFAAMLIGGIAAERAARGWLPADDDHDDYYGAVVAGDPLSARSRKEIGRDLALKNSGTRVNAVISSIARHARRHPKAGA